jgi:rare lipoprotein A
MLKKLVLSAIALLGLATGLITIRDATAAQTGMASYYWQGRQTANGELYRPDGISAAHKTLPFGTLVRVTMLRSGRSIVVRINDRGPFIRGRIIDLSRGAARRVGLTGSGVAQVRVDVIGRQGSARYAGNSARRTKPSLAAKAKLRRAKAVQVAAAQAKARRSVGGKAKRRS